MRKISRKKRRRRIIRKTAGMLLMGFDENYYYFCDPLSQGAVVSYEKSLVEQRYEEMGRQAVVVY